MKKIIIVMPVANEEATMGQVIDKILALPYDNLYLYPVVDSYSKDRTEEIIRSYESTGRVKCIFYKESRGVISCYLEGYRQALADGAGGILEMDGGGSHQRGCPCRRGCAVDGRPEFQRNHGPCGAAVCSYLCGGLHRNRRRQGPEKKHRPLGGNRRRPGTDCNRSLGSALAHIVALAVPVPQAYDAGDDA